MMACPQEHVSVCLRFPTNCSNGCDEILAREEVKIVLIFVILKMYYSSKNKLIEFSIGLNEAILLSVISLFQIMNHITDDCPLTLIHCPYFEMGCDMKV